MTREKDFPMRVYAYRLSPSPTVPLLAGARSAGSYKLGANWRQPPKRGEFLELFWCMEGTFRFPLPDGQETLLHPDQSLFLLPGDWHRQTVQSGPARCCWLTLDGEVESLISACRIDRRARSSGPCPEHLFLKLIREILHLSPAMQYQAAGTALQLVHLALSATGENTDHTPARDFEKLVEAHFHDPNCSVEGLAERLDLSRITLYRAVRHRCGCTPKEYLDRRRLREALNLLHDTQLPIREIARRSGYAHSSYFIRVFHRKMKTSPGEFRRAAPEN